MLEPGTLLAERYRIIRLIGVGGMGAVFEAENIITHKRVAIKWLQPLMADRPEAAHRLLREAQAASRIRHPNVVDVYDVVRDGDTLFLVLELLEGEPLEHVFEKESLPLPELLHVLAEAMRGVAAAHKEGVIHRDLHPGNIFVLKQPDSEQFTAKVLDFGISKFSGNESVSITQPGMTLGTPLYMSFEQLRGEPDIDSRADVYAFGVIVYEALTGRLPFEAGSLPELAIKFATSTPTSARLLRPAVPESLDRVLSTALARDREQRLPNMEALIREVEAFAAVTASRSRSAEDLLGLTDDRPPPHQIVTLGRQVGPVVAASEAPKAGASPGLGMTWIVTLIGALAAAALSAWLVISMRGTPNSAARGDALEESSPTEPPPEPGGLPQVAPSATREERRPTAPQALPEQRAEQRRSAAPTESSQVRTSPRPSPTDTRPQRRSPDEAAPAEKRKSIRLRSPAASEPSAAPSATPAARTRTPAGEQRAAEESAPSSTEADRAYFRAGRPPSRDDF